jgi:integrase
MFVVHMGTALRRGEVAGLRWRSVFLADPHGAYLRVADTFLQGRDDTPKSEAGKRTIDLGQRVASELMDHLAWSAFDGDDEFVLCNPRTGRPFSPQRFSVLMAKARVRAGIAEYLRPSHDLRHSSITNAARAGTDPAALMTRSGHSNFSTTQRYVHLAGARFTDEATMLEDGSGRRRGARSRPDSVAG